MVYSIQKRIVTFSLLLMVSHQGAHAITILNYSKDHDKNNKIKIDLVFGTWNKDGKPDVVGKQAVYLNSGCCKENIKIKGYSTWGGKPIYQLLEIFANRTAGTQNRIPVRGGKNPESGYVFWVEPPAQSADVKQGDTIVIHGNSDGNYYMQVENKCDRSKCQCWDNDLANLWTKSTAC